MAAIIIPSAPNSRNGNAVPAVTLSRKDLVAKPYFLLASSTCLSLAGSLIFVYVCLSFYSYSVLERYQYQVSTSHVHTVRRNDYHHNRYEVGGHANQTTSNIAAIANVEIKGQQQQVQVEETVNEERFWYQTLDRDKLHAWIRKHASNDGDSTRSGTDRVWRPITAYVEPPERFFRDTVPGTADRGDMKNDKDPGTPPRFVAPMPLRTHAPDDLVPYEYPAVRTCRDLPHKFPVDRGIQYDERGNVVVWNVGDAPTPPDFPQWEASEGNCPVEYDPFLPWIHDYFPNEDGSLIEFVGQNKRRCRTGTKFTDNVHRLVPQVALMQPVTVERITESRAQQLAPDLWSPRQSSTSTTTTAREDRVVGRYRLAPMNESTNAVALQSPSSPVDERPFRPMEYYTRFICRFYTVHVNSDDDADGNNSNNRDRGATASGDGKVPYAVIGETLSVYPFNYEYASYRKGVDNLLTAKGKDTTYFWASVLRFQCPVPDVGTLRDDIVRGRHLLDDGTSTVTMELVPIRTSARYDEVYLSEYEIGPPGEQRRQNSVPLFDPYKRWGPNQVLPRVEASGRWSNLPICAPPPNPIAPTTQATANAASEGAKGAIVVDDRANVAVERKLRQSKRKKAHYLSACLWASAEFKTRGRKSGAESDTALRLQEWLEFHFMVGFDHIYLYDNSGAHTNETSLKEITDKYPASKITRIEWPSIPCNNNIPAHDSTGERSSQYAAENSCRTRYAPHTEWIAVFDTDEYLVPMGNYTNLKDVLKNAEDHGTRVLTMRSSRGYLRQEHSIVSGDKGNAMEKNPNATYLEAYNCDSGGVPKPSWAERARKQIYRSDYVYYHYVHYSTITESVVQPYAEIVAKGEQFRRGHKLAPAYKERVSDEINEAVMVHTKTILNDMTTKWKTKCHKDYDKKWQGCYVGIPWPNNRLVKLTKKEEKAKIVKEGTYDKDTGLMYNCFINNKVDDYWIPKLKDALRTRREMWAKQAIE